MRTLQEKLFRGEHCGVFTGPNGYYVAGMAADGVSHYQPQSGGNGWSDATRHECNREAEALENGNDRDNE